MIDLIDDGPDGEEAERSSTGRSWTGPLGLACLAAVAVLAWALTRPSSDAEPGPDEAVIEQGVGDTPATTLILPTTRPPATSPSTQLPGSQIMGEPTGLWLFFGGDANLQRLDLDTGVVDLFGLRAHALMVVGTELVVGHANTGSVGWVSLDNPGEQPNSWKDARIAPDTRPGHLWTYEASVWTRFDLADNGVVETIEARAPAPLGVGEGRPAIIVPGPQLISTANGVFEATDAGEHVKVADGRLLTYDTDRLLVERCTRTLTDCEMQWLARGSWAALDLPTPSPGTQFAEILGGGRYLHTVDGSGSRHQVLLLDLPPPSNQETVPISLDVTDRSLTISSDGRWLALGPEADGLVDIVDLTTGELMLEFSGFNAEVGGSVLFVDQAAAIN